MDFRNVGSSVLGVTVPIALLVLETAQYVAGSAGIAHSYGWGWSVGAVVLSLFFRFPFALAFGCYLYVTEVLRWPAAYGVLFAVPGLVLMVPTLVVSLLSGLRERPLRG